MAIESTSCVQPFHQLRGGLQVYGWMFFFSAFYVVFAGVSSEGPTLPPDYEFVYPLPCDFESSLCQWVQMTADNFDWIRQNGSTPTSGTGPTGDHTNGDGSGHYIYIETSYPRKEDEDARLISNYINPSESDDCTLSFYYHMYGNALGSLNIYSKEVSSTVEDLRWSINGSQGNSWIDGTVSFLSMQHPFQIIIEGVVGNGVRGDIALDDTSFSDGCFKGEDGKVRLVNDGSSSSPNEGRVEVYYNNTWGTICEYDGVWNQSTEGKVICQQLGYQSAEDATSFYPPSHSVPVHLDNVDCTGTELLLTECSNDGWGVARSQCLAPGMRFTDVAVKCTDMAPPPCHLDQFICSNEMCVSNGKLCDYTDNCGDASDEHISLCDSYPGRCDFQDDLCNWIQPSNDDFDWTRQKGSTPTPNTGPDGDHNGMSDKYYMLMEATGRTQYDKAKLALPQTFLPTTDDLCKIRFYYHMTGNDVGVLRLKMLSTTSHAISTVWLESSPQGNDWKFTLITLSNAESFQLYFEGEIGRSDAGDISVDDISFSLGCELANGTCDYDDEPTFNCTNTGECILADHTCDYHHNCLDGSDESPDVCNSRPGICDFQNHFCSWDQSCFDDFDWKRNKWDTDTTSTGPSKDHTLKNILGYYAYIEASNQNPGEVADLVSTSWSASVDRPCYLRFYYHMYGTGIGSLKVIVKDVMSSASVEKWSESGNQGNEWQFASVDLQNSYAEFEVILRAMRGYDNEGKGDIAIDDVSFSEGCEVQTDLLPSDEAEGVRLVDGDDSSEGRIEVFKNSQWGTVCDTTNGFDSRDAGVVCKQLGFKGQLEVKRGGHFGKGSGQIWMTNVGCTGNENSLLECSHSTGTTSCSHDNDVGVICDKTETSGQAVRLTGGRTDVPFEGRVEIFHGGQWGTVCNTTFGLNEAIVVCKQLGYDGAYRPQSFGAGSGSIHLSYLDCCGSELSLSLCRHSSWNTTSTCDHSQDAGVICRSDDHPPEGITYLKHGTESYEGRLEIYHDSQWGTICSNEWSINDAYVACRELNFRSALVYLTNEFGQGSGKTHLNKVGCQGDERHLIDCDHGAWGDYQCSTGHDVGIECTDTITHSLTLVEEDTVGNKGCVQLMSESHPQKKQVCLNGLSDETKTVICHQLGFDGYETIDTSSTCSTGNPRVMIAFPSCSGTEARLSDCTDYAWIPASGSQCGSSTSDPKIVCKVRTTTTIPPQTTHTVVTAPDTHTVPSGSVFTIEGGCDSGAVTHSYGDRKAYIWSPNYPQSYDNNLDCAWTVTLNLKDTIAIQFEALHTEDHDELELYDGDSDDATELGSYSGVQFLETVRTTGRHLYVTFESDNNQICTGFKLLLSVNSDPLPKLLFGPVTQKCCEQTSDEIFDDTYDGNFEKGSIKSPGHPKRYLSHLSCGWMVKLNDSQKVTMTISELDIKDDKLAMFDGKGVSADVLGEYTGEMRRRKRSSDVEPIQSTRNVVVMKFTTNGINQGNGFIVEYEGQEDGPIPLPNDDKSNGGAIAIGFVTVLLIIIAVILLTVGYMKHKNKRLPFPDLFGCKDNNRQSRYAGHDEDEGNDDFENQSMGSTVQITTHGARPAVEHVYATIDGRSSVYSGPPPPYTSHPDIGSHVQVSFQGHGQVLYSPGAPSAPPAPKSAPIHHFNYEKPQTNRNQHQDDDGYTIPAQTPRSDYERPQFFTTEEKTKYEAMRSVNPSNQLGNQNDDDIKKGAGLPMGDSAYVNLPPEGAPNAPPAMDKQVYQFLLDLDVEGLADIFAKEDIKYDDLFILTDKDLRNMGIPMGPTKRILKRLKRISRRSEKTQPQDTIVEEPESNGKIPVQVDSADDKCNGEARSDKHLVFTNRYSAAPSHYLQPVQVRQVEVKSTPENHMYDTIQGDFEIPSKYRCPITNDIMVHPFTATDGNTYERTNIMEWFAKAHTSPVTGQPLNDIGLAPNVELEKEIQRFRKKAEKRYRREQKDKRKRDVRDDPSERPGTPLTDVDC